MTAIALSDLPPGRQADVLAALAAVETADAPVAVSGFRALADPTLKATLNHCLREQGRVLIKVANGWLSGYDDGVATKLVTEGVGVLPTDDRAVLALVLLHCVAIPRAAGRIKGESWLEAEPITYTELHRSQLPDSRVRASVRRLRDAGILRYGVRRSILPGPQFARLTPTVSAALWEELVLLAQPRGLMADVIRRRRAARHDHTGSTDRSTGDTND